MSRPAAPSEEDVLRDVLAQLAITQERVRVGVTFNRSVMAGVVFADGPGFDLHLRRRGISAPVYDLNLANVAYVEADRCDLLYAAGRDDEKIRQEVLSGLAGSGRIIRATVVTTDEHDIVARIDRVDGEGVTLTVLRSRGIHLMKLAYFRRIVASTTLLWQRRKPYPPPAERHSPACEATGTAHRCPVCLPELEPR